MCGTGLGLRIPHELPDTRTLKSLYAQWAELAQFLPADGSRYTHWMVGACLWGLARLGLSGLLSRKFGPNLGVQGKDFSPCDATLRNGPAGFFQ